MINKKKYLFLVSALLILPAHVQAVSLYNPLGNVDNLPALINNGIKGVLGIVGAVSLIMMVIGGVTWMTSAGNADRIRRGRDTLVWAIMGLLAVFLSYAIINFVFGALLTGDV
ncbi:hypothetical protein HN670_03185 [bacterium]|jgi:hypothetical protein|nr:hypothetical protein [bacterium]